MFGIQSLPSAHFFLSSLRRRKFPSRRQAPPAISPGTVLSSFRDHWLNLRQPTEGAPALSRFLDHANPSTAPFTYIVDGEQRQRRVILFGTGISETYGRDLTGFTLADMLPGSAERSVVARVRRVSSVHCGLIVVSGFMGRDNLPMRGTFLMLPLLKKAGETVIAGAAEFEYDIGSGASTTGSGRVALLQCIDIRPQTPV